MPRYDITEQNHRTDTDLQTWLYDARWCANESTPTHDAYRVYDLRESGLSRTTLFVKKDRTFRQRNADLRRKLAAFVRTLQAAAQQPSLF
jgi:hypothetical protein